jgi:serine protease Do
MGINKIYSAFIIFLLCCGCTKKDPREKIAELEEELQALKQSISQSEAAPSAISGYSKSEAQKSDLIVEVIKSVIPSVVSIHSEKIIEVKPHQYFNPFEEFFFFFGDPHRQEPGQRKHKQQGLGSGVIISEKGHILTNHHVAGDADELKVTFTDEREFEAELVGSDKLSDVAVIKIKNPPDNLPVAVLGDSEKLEVGETVITIGNPFGYSNTVTSGIISAKGRRVGINSYENYLQTDASINPGNSGGALVDLDGKLVGINTAIASRTGASHGIGFAIPINMANDIMKDLIGEGIVTRGYLGVYLQKLDKNISSALELKSTRGALVSGVIQDSPAEKAGFQEMDVIIKVQGKKIKDANHLRNTVAMLEPGKTCKFTIIRNKKEKTIKVKIGIRDEEQTAETPKKKSEENYGLTLENIDRNHVYRYNLNITSGIVVTGIEVGTSADKAGFKEGDVIMTVNKQRVNSVRKFQKIIKSSKKDTHLVLIDRGGANMYLGLKTK